MRVRRRISRAKRSEWFFGYLFILPLAVGLALFYVWPVIYCLWISFTQWDGMGTPSFIGLENYTTLFKSPEVGREFSNTFYYTFVSVPVTIVLSVVLANILNSRLIRGKSAYKVIYFLPSVTMGVAVALVWRWLFNSKYGLVNLFLSWVGVNGPAWLADPKWMMPAVIITNIWGGIGYNMILLLSGLQGIPRTYYESAEIDGASAVRQFFRITVPLLSPTIFFISIMSFINAFKAFDSIFMFASKSSGVLLDSIKTVVYGIYRTGFAFNNMGLASAEAIVLCVLILAFTGVQFIAQKKWVYYE